MPPGSTFFAGRTTGRSAASAAEHARLLCERGYAAQVVAVRASGRTLHAVRVGPYASRSDAKRMAAKLKGQGFEAIVKP